MQDSTCRFGTGIYRGWRTLCGGLLTSLLAIGSTTYISGFLLIPVAEEFHLSRTEASLGLVVLMAGAGLWGAVVGRLIDRMNVKRVVPLGGVLIALGALAIANARQPEHLLLATFFLSSLGAVCAGSQSCNAVVSRWFYRRRGRAMGIMALSSSAAGFFIPPVFAALLLQYGWRIAIAALGCSVGFLICMIGLSLMTDRPSAAELASGGEVDPHEAAVGAVLLGKDWRVPDLFRQRNFLILLISISLLVAADQAILVNWMPFLHSKSVVGEWAALLIAVQAAAALIGKLVLGMLAEQYDLRHLMSFVAFMHVLAISFMLYWPGYWGMVAVLAVVGGGFGGVFPVFLNIVARYFGTKSFGLITGLIGVGYQLLSIIFILMAGRIFDATGGYDAILILFFICAVSAGIGVQMLTPQRTDGGSDQAKQGA